MLEPRRHTTTKQASEATSPRRRRWTMDAGRLILGAAVATAVAWTHGPAHAVSSPERTIASVLASAPSSMILAQSAPPSDRLRGVEPAGAAEKKQRPTVPAGPDGAERGPGGRRGQDIPVERFIEVAEDIEPGWAKTLREKLETDREATTKAIRQNGQRLVGLVMLKERNPGLYDMKVKELQAQIEARKVARQYHEAKDSNRDDDCGRAMERIRELCERIVNLQLWQRANELNSLEIFVKEQRETLERDAKPEGSKVLVDQLVATMMRARPAQGLLEVIERSDPDRDPIRDPMREGGRDFDRGHDRPRPTAEAVPPPAGAPPLGPPPPADPAIPGGPPLDGGHHWHGGFGPPGARGEGNIERVLDRFVAVARDISPAAADRLEAELAADRDGTIRGIKQGGPRFVGLVLLKERDADLYAMKVRELQKHLDLRTAAQDYHNALSAANARQGDTGAATQRMQAISGEIIELQLKQRAHEVTSLVRLLDSERAELAHESQPEQTKARRDTLVAELMDAPPRPGLADMLESGGPRGPAKGEVPARAE